MTAMTTMSDDKKISADLVQKTINTIRFLAVDAVEAAKSGHPGLPMGMAPVAYVLWSRFLKHNPKNPSWDNRDRFVLSAGHGSMLLYALLHLTGYDVSLEDLKNFRQWESKTPGHPEFGHTPGVETTTGPLGQGLATAVGMAIGQRYLNSLLAPGSAPLLDYRIFGICSDGDMMEGIASEAASLAGHLGLSSLKLIFDDNRITIDGTTDLTFTEDVGARFAAYGWNILRVADANDVTAVAEALDKAVAETHRPTLILVRSRIGFGSPNKGGTSEAHGAPLGPEEAKLSKENLKWPATPAFLVPEDVRTHMIEAVTKGAALEKKWREAFDAWRTSHPQEHALYERLEKGSLPDGWESLLPTFDGESKMATRSASGKVVNALAARLPELIGGSADLAGSNNTTIKGAPNFGKTGGRTIHFGVREHAMGAVLNGMALSNKLIPYGGTFLIFSDYMKGAIRLAALMRRRVIYVFTHDTIGLGEDGPTHQPVEQVAALRAMPNILVIRPADAIETAAAWKTALKNSSGPTALVLTRQNLPVLSRASYPEAGRVEKGAYILAEGKGGKPRLILIASGSEVAVALQAKDLLEKEGTPTRVVSMPCWELFDRQPAAYQESVLPKAVKHRVAVEALSTFGWERYVGWDGAVVGMTSFGASAPGDVLMEKFGFTATHVADVARKIVKAQG